LLVLLVPDRAALFAPVPRERALLEAVAAFLAPVPRERGLFEAVDRTPFTRA
jgi:hypothetical protein